MSRLPEPLKVQKITQALEDSLQGDLFFRDEENPIGRIKVSRRGFGSEYGSPDAVVWVEMRLRILGVSVEVRTPILIEAEDAGLSAAKDDVRKFFERDRLEIPMVVVGREKAPSLETRTEAKANVDVPMHQIGLDRVLDD